jgi:hypothetical protein
VTITLGGSDPADARSGACDPHIAQYRIDSLPAGGALEVEQGGTFTAAHPGAVTARADVRWTPPAEAGTWSFTFDVEDTGCPAPGAWSAVAGQVLLTNSGTDAAPSAALTLTPDRPAALTGAVTADASGSRTSDGQPAAFTFTWGDGTTTGPQPQGTATHTYAAPASTPYRVVVQVTDSHGRTATATSAATVQPNLLPNPTGDTDTHGWQADPTAAATAGTSEDSAHGGTGSVTISCPAAGACGLQTTGTEPTSASGAYTASVWVRPGAAAVGQSITLTLTEGTNAGTVATTQTTVTLTGGWQQVTLAYTPVRAGDQLTLAASLPGWDGARAPAFSVDDASLTH